MDKYKKIPYYLRGKFITFVFKWGYLLVEADAFESGG